MEEEEWEDGKRQSILSITVHMRYKSSSDRSHESSERQGSQAHKRRKSDMLSSSVRCEDPKGGSRGESESETNTTQDETAGHNMNRSWSRVPPEQAESRIRTSGERDREGRQKVADERGTSPPGHLCHTNGKPQPGGRGG